MTTFYTVHEVRAALQLRRELALLDLREEASFALGHPLFAAQLPLDRIATEAQVRVPRRDVQIVLYGDGSDAERGRDEFRRLGYTRVALLQGGLDAWRSAGFELFADVNSYSKAFGELVEARRHTPSLSAEEVSELIAQKADIAIVDARRFEEYSTMSIPSGTSVPGAELVLRVPAIAPNPRTTVIVNCAGRTRSIIGAQSLINAGLRNRVVALRNGTIGWKLAGQTLETGQQRRAPTPSSAGILEARQRAREVAYQSGVRHIGRRELGELQRDTTRSSYFFDVRTPEEYAAGHLPGFRSAPGGQLVQETDFFAPVRGARVVLHDDLGTRAEMTASWLAQMAWDVYVFDGGDEHVTGQDPQALPPRATKGRYKRPYEGTDSPASAMRAYLDWEFGLVEQLRRDGTHGFFVV
ncbi:MAG TPA: rhodanese-like domain-containing protein [Polyangiaceae bacterium]|nr:rhodanese-like domain-containing protein [Polyangiaceae bacterium]